MKETGLITVLEQISEAKSFSIGYSKQLLQYGTVVAHRI